MVGERVGPYWKPESHSYTGALHSTTTQGHAGREEPPKLCRHPFRDSGGGAGETGWEETKEIPIQSTCKDCCHLAQWCGQEKGKLCRSKNTKNGHKAISFLHSNWNVIDAELRNWLAVFCSRRGGETMGGEPRGALANVTWRNDELQSNMLDERIANSKEINNSWKRNLMRQFEP